MSELRFIDKLREETNEGIPDGQLVDECMELVNKITPNIDTEIPQNVQEKMLNIASRQKNSIEFNSPDQLKNFIPCLCSEENIRKIKKVFRAAYNNEKVTVLDGAIGHEGLGPWLMWKNNDDKYGLQLDFAVDEVTIMFAPSWKTAIKIFENQGFKVTPLYNNKILNLKIIGITVEW